MGRPCRLATTLAVLALSTLAQAQGVEVRKYLNAAVTLYENLEYERALKQIQRAKAKSTGAADDARIALYEGIVLADMGKVDGALNAFKTGLAMEPEAKLPLQVSPKVEKVFNAARDNVRKMIGSRLEEDRLRLEAEEKKAAEVVPPHPEPARSPPAELPPPVSLPPTVPPTVSSGPSMRTWAIAPLAVGVASAGAATYFLIGAKNRERLLSDGQARPSEAVAIRDAGKTMAIAGYACTGLALAGWVAAGVMFGVGSHESSPALTLIATPGQTYVEIKVALP